MNERQAAEAIGNLVGVVTALEMQVQALLLAATKAGMDPKDVRQVVEAMPVPFVPESGRDALPPSHGWLHTAARADRGAAGR
jgi:hypothetical protein